MFSLYMAYIPTVFLLWRYVCWDTVYNAIIGPLDIFSIANTLPATNQPKMFGISAMTKESPSPLLPPPSIYYYNAIGMYAWMLYVMAGSSFLFIKVAKQSRVWLTGPRCLVF